MTVTNIRVRVLAIGALSAGVLATPAFATDLPGRQDDASVRITTLPLVPPDAPVGLLFDGDAVPFTDALPDEALRATV